MWLSSDQTPQGPSWFPFVSFHPAGPTPYTSSTALEQPASLGVDTVSDGEVVVDTAPAVIRALHPFRPMVDPHEDGAVGLPVIPSVIVILMLNPVALLIHGIDLRISLSAIFLGIIIVAVAVPMGNCLHRTVWIFLPERHKTDQPGRVLILEIAD